jgi:glycosyltransferase involved in cell wall biosynthesis
MTKPLRIAFVHDTFSVYRRPLFQLLAERFDLHFFFLNEKETSLLPDAESIRGWRIPKMSDYVVAPSLTARIMEAHRIKPFDLIFVPEPSSFSAQAAWWAARRLRLPYVTWSGEWYTARHPRRWLMRPLEGAIARGAAVCLAYGSRASRRLQALGVPEGKILLSGNASDYHFIRASVPELEAAREKWGIGERRVILFLGRMIGFKAPDLLLEAFVSIENCHAFLLLAGDGPLLPMLRARIADRLPGRALCTGTEVRGPEEKNLLYSLASVFVLPSRRERVAEPWGLVLNEAASAALPIVTARSVGAVGDLIRDRETGIVVPENDPLALADAIALCLRAPEEIRAMAMRAQRAAAGFTIERMADAFSAAFARAAEER